LGQWATAREFLEQTEAHQPGALEHRERYAPVIGSIVYREHDLAHHPVMIVLGVFPFGREIEQAVDVRTVEPINSDAARGDVLASAEMTEDRAADKPFYR